MSQNLDETDREILEILRRDARTPFTEVGRELGISDATVHIRVKRMMDTGIIEEHRSDRRGGFWRKGLRLRSDECEVRRPGGGVETAS